MLTQTHSGEEVRGQQPVASASNQVRVFEQRRHLGKTWLMGWCPFGVP